MARPADAAPTLLDHLSERDLAAWIPPRAREAGAELVAAGRTTRPRLSSGKAVAVVAAARARYRVELRAGKRGIAWTCACGAGASPCAHVAALAVLLTGAAWKESEATTGDPLEAERLRRVERGRSGLFTIRARGDRPPPHGTHDVRSPSGQSYEVVIRALDEPHNGCTCADFRTNDLGLCKHVVAVLEHLTSGRIGRARLETARKLGAPQSYLHIERVTSPRVALRLSRRPAEPAVRILRRWFDDDGRLRAPLADAWPDLSPACASAGIEVPAEVRHLARRALEARDRERRQLEIEREVARAGVDQAGFRGKLYPYQVDGVAFLASRGRALLADDMGLGKTAQAIAAMVRLFRKQEIQRALVVCPASLKHQWAQEIERFVDLPGVRTTVVGGARAARAAVYANPGEIVITSYELVRADEKDVAALAPDLLILDEAQRIKNWRTRTADVVKRIPTARAFVLTGTPLENRLDDLYSLMQVVDPHLLGPLWRFNRDFAAQDERGKPTGYKNLGELRGRIRPLFLRRRKQDVLDQLPERIDNRIVVALDAEQREIHDEAEASAARLLAIVRRRPLSPIEEQRLMRAFQRMRMACDAAVLCGAPVAKGRAPRSAKLDELERLLDEICAQGGHKVVVFSEWEKMQALAADVAQRLGVGHVRLNGGVPAAKRGALIARFREDPSCKVFFSTDAGGVGLNLQVADHLINLDMPWNPAVLEQRIARIHRLGQSRTVNVVLLLAEASIESRMEGTLAAKRALFEAAVGDSDVDAVDRSTLASRIATILGESYASGTGPTPAEPPAPRAPLDDLRERLGPALERVLRLREGQLVAVVADGTPIPPAGTDGIVYLGVATASAMAALGARSPLVGAETIFTSAPASPDAGRRAACLSVATRKLACAHTLRSAGEHAEALTLLHGALAALCRAAADRDPGDDAAGLLAIVYAELVPTGVLTPADAHALSRAGELARAFAATPIPPPATLVDPLLADATDLASRLRERPGQVAPRSADALSVTRAVVGGAPN